MIVGILGVCLLAAVATVGCKKETPPPGSSVQILDASKLRPAFVSAPPEAQAIVDSVMMSIQSSNFQQARADLDKLAKMPGVTPQQQAVVKDLGEQLDKKIADIAAAAAAAQKQ